MSYENHGRKHRWKAQGGTDPIPVSLPFADYAMAYTSSAPTAAETYMLQFDALSTAWHDFFEITAADSFPPPIESASAGWTTKGAAKIVMPGHYWVTFHADTFGLSGANSTLTWMVYNKTGSSPWQHSSSGAPLWNNAITKMPIGSLTTYSGDAFEMFWHTVGVSSSSSPAYIKPTVLLGSGVAVPYSLPAFTMRVVRIAEFTRQRTVQST